MKRYAVLDEAERVVTEWDVAFDAVASRRLGEPARDAWSILDRETGRIHR
ncbi:hypothetical protein [Microbacterium sp. KNMS]